MYNESGFLDLEFGSIGTVFYKIDMSKSIPEEVKQDIVSKNANERMRAFLMNMTYGMNGNGPTDPLDAYIKARQDSWGDIEDGEMTMKIENMIVQIGQKESYDSMVKIETREDFGGWLNPALVELIKQQYKNQ